MFFDKMFSKKPKCTIESRKDFITMLAKSLGHDRYTISKDELLIRGELVIKLKFTSSNYASKNNVDLNATVYIIDAEKEYVWTDLFHLTKQFLVKYHTPLSISKSEDWYKSKVYQDTINIYKPLFKILTSKNLLDKFFNGQLIELDDKRFQLSDSDEYRHLAVYSKELSAKMIISYQTVK